MNTIHNCVHNSSHDSIQFNPIQNLRLRFRSLNLIQVVVVVALIMGSNDISLGQRNYEEIISLS